MLNSQTMRDIDETDKVINEFFKDKDNKNNKKFVVRSILAALELAKDMSLEGIGLAMMSDEEIMEYIDKKL